jgi:hypothetical protein
VFAAAVLTAPDTTWAAPGASGTRPDMCHHDQGHEAAEQYLCAQAGDMVDVRIGDVLPTQPSLGYDEVYYKLGRYTLGKDAINKKFDDWCEASGLVPAAWVNPGARLDDPAATPRRTSARLPHGTGAAPAKGEFGKLSKPYSDTKPGKIAYALAYKAQLSL